MGIVLIGMGTGILASISALLVGHTIGTALLMYILAGMIGTLFAALAVAFPQERPASVDSFAAQQRTPK
jgi:hypothetical protein